MTELVDELHQQATGAATDTPQDQAFECPDCDRIFEGKQGLALHRSRVHGVKGATRRRKTGAARKTRPSRSRSAARVRAPKPLNEAAVLREIFPSGNVPVKSLARVNALLAEARSLHG